MPAPASVPAYIAFHGPQRIASGELPEVALAVKHAIETRSGGTVLMFDYATGRALDVDVRGTDAEMLERLAKRDASVAFVNAARSRGRPKLGVVAREVTLLPRHWEWLAGQPGGASVTLRKLVEAARRSGTHARRHAHERAYHFINALAGNLPGFEEATRALFADDAARFETLIAEWPPDVRDLARQFAFGATPGQQAAG